MSYITVKAPAQDEFIEKKSRFIGYISPVRTPEEAAAFIAEIKALHREATHNVSAWKLRDGQKRYSDDGELQGTAGIPVLDVIEKEGLVDVCIVATRYFGGILLGGGGLVRAYSHTAKLAVDAAQKLTMFECRQLSAALDYSLYGKLSYILPDYEVKVLSSDFGEKVTLSLLIKSERYPEFEKAYCELTNGQGELATVEEKFDFF